MKLSKISILCLSSIAMTANAQDARSLAMGGTGIITGKGAAGALHNPALLAKHKDQGLKGSFRLGLGVAVNDPDNLKDDLRRVDDVINTLDKEASRLENSVNINSNCPNLASINGDTVCATGLKKIREASEEAFNLLDDIDGKPLEIGINTGLGFSYVGGSLPFAINSDTSLIFNGSGKLHNDDKAFFNDFIKHSGDIDNLTVNDIKNNGRITVNTATGKVNINEDYESQSSGEGFVIANSELAVSMAKKATYKGDKIYLGLTPKYIKSAASSVSFDADKETEDLRHEIEDNQVEDDNYTVDAGFLIPVPTSENFSIGASFTDIAAYSVETQKQNGKDTLRIHTKPQATVAFGYETKNFNVTSEVALNAALKNGIETRPVSLGAEVNSEWFGLRAGISHDLQQKDSTSYSVGVDLGFIEIGAKINEESTAEVTTQIAFEF